MYPPPQEWKSWIQVKVTFCFWLMYSPQEWKSWTQVKVTFCFWLMYPPQEWNSWIQVKVTFWFWLMYPPRNEIVGYRSKWHFASGWCTPPKIEIGLNMNAIAKKSFQERSSSTFYQSNPPSIIIIWFYAWTGNWWISISNGYMDSNPPTSPLQPKK